MPVFLVALLNNAASFYTYRPGGMADGSDQVKTAWLAAWDVLNDPNFSGVNHVRPDGSDTADCQSWESACTLQRALSHFVPGMEVWVAEGTYKPTVHYNQYRSFKLKNGVDVYGGFDGSERTLGERDWATHVTVLSGDLSGDDTCVGNKSDNSFHVVVASSVTDATTFKSIYLPRRKFLDSLHGICIGQWHGLSLSL